MAEIPHTLVIADGGACHDGQFDKQVRLIEAAKAAGCDCYKTQWTSDPHLMAARRGKALEDGYEAIYRRYLNWPQEWHAELAAKCQAVGVEYMCTCFLKQDLPVVAPHVQRFKIASFEAADEEFY